MSDVKSEDLSANSASPPTSQFRTGSVLKILIPAALILGGAFVFFGILDGSKWIANFTKPTLVTVHGKVFFNGEPLTEAEIYTQPVKPGLRGSYGTSNDKGRFTLLTDVNGDFLDGAYAGKHKVTVLKRHNVVTFGPAPGMTPPKYAAFDTSPLEIEVAKGKEVELRLEGQATTPPRPMGPMTQRRPSDQNNDPEKKEESENKEEAKKE